MLDGKDALRYARRRLGFVTYWRCRIADATSNFLWRTRYTIYGQRKTGWGWRLWWYWSGCDIDHDVSPAEAADDNIYAAMT